MNTIKLCTVILDIIFWEFLAINFLGVVWFLWNDSCWSWRMVRNKKWRGLLHGPDLKNYQYPIRHSLPHLEHPWYIQVRRIFWNLYTLTMDRNYSNLLFVCLIRFINIQNYHFDGHDIYSGHLHLSIKYKIIDEILVVPGARLQFRLSHVIC